MSGRVLIVGAGFAGAVIAERLASAGIPSLVIDRRPHIGGNAFDRRDEHGLLIHQYGPHLFHTNSQRIFEYLSRFTEWRPYEHRVLAVVDGKKYPIPINRTTINQLYGLDLDEAGVRAYLDRVREPKSEIKNGEDVVLNAVGRDLYEKFFRGYTRKQWGVEPSELAGSVTARIPVRTNDDDRYFTDTYQAMPLHGYTRMFENILRHPLIEVQLGVDFVSVRETIDPLHTVYTGPVDAYFEYCFGKLPYRSLRFEHEHLPDTPQFQPVTQVNYPNDHEYTRITEFKHATGDVHPGTSITREYPTAEGDPYYPVPSATNEQLFRRYEELAAAEPNVTFVGRLAQYRYYNMDQVVGTALVAAERLIEALASPQDPSVAISA
jgi:UDP-galactopyranose mutase